MPVSDHAFHFDIVILGGILVRPGLDPTAGNLGIRAGKIAAVMDPSLPLAGSEVVDATGLHVFPGVIESHSHWGTRGELEDFFTESRSAVIGGVTTNLLFLRKNEPYDALFSQYRDYGETRSIIDFSFHAVLMIEEHLNEIDHYVHDFGITSFKFYLTYRGEDAEFMGIQGIDDGFMFDCFSRVARHDKALIIVHCENIELIHRMRARLKAENRDDMDSWQASRPLLAEVEGVRRAMLFAEATGCRLNVLHLTSKAALSEVRLHRKRYSSIYVEVCHPYLTLNADTHLTALGKMKPPLRTRGDNDALWEGLFDGSINTVATDHVPRKLEGKMGPVWGPQAGGPGTATLLPIMLSEGYHKRGLSLSRIAELTSLNPARLYGLYPRKGTLDVNGDADITIVDLEAERTVRARELLSYADFSFYEGWQLKGWPKHTMVRGNWVLQEGNIVGKPGIGEYIPR